MAESAKILAQMRKKHSKKLGATHERILCLLDKLDNPHERLPSVVHIAGSHNKENIQILLKEMLSAAGYTAHVYKSRHFIDFHERIGLHTEQEDAFQISEDALVDVLGRVLEANDNEPITFFELFTAAALLSFSEHPADFLLLSSGAGGGLDPTNVVQNKVLTVITSVSTQNSHFIGNSVTEAAIEFSGIMTAGVPCIVGEQSPEGSAIIENYADELSVSIYLSGREWMSHEQHGRLLYQDQSSLLDLPLPRNAIGPNQIHNAGIAIAACRQITEDQLSENEYSVALNVARFPAQLQSISSNVLLEHLDAGSEVWLDSGSYKEDALVLAQAMADLEGKVQNPLHLIVSMKQNLNVSEFLSPFVGLAEFVATIDGQNIKGTYSASELAKSARQVGLNSAPQAGVLEALQTCRSVAGGSSRVLICGSVEFAGYILDEYC